MSHLVSSLRIDFDPDVRRPTMTSALSVAVGLTVATGCGLVANLVAQKLVPSKQVIAGFPRWRWVLSSFTQAVAFPTILAISWHSSSAVSFSQWAESPAHELSVSDRIYVLALFASQSRDMFPMPRGASTLMWLHHWIVMIASAAAFFLPVGFGLFVSVTFVLELGSMTFNLHSLYPKSSGIASLYQICMLTSNVAAIVGSIYAVQNLALPEVLLYPFVIANLGVCVGRQRHALKVLAESP